MKSGKSISIIIPAYNEEKYISTTLNNLNFTWVDEIIVVNDGSSDNTLEIVKNYQVKVVNLTKNAGKGRAVEEGVKACKGSIITLVDADLGESVREIEKLVEPVVMGEIEMAIAVIPIVGGGLGLVRKIADYGLQNITGVKMRAPLSGQRAFSRDIIDYIFPLCSGFGLEIGMDIGLIRNDIKYREIECDFSHRVTKRGVKDYLHRGKQFWDIFITLSQLRR